MYYANQYFSRREDQHGWLVHSLLCGRSQVWFLGVTTNPCFDFFPFRVALNTLKTEHWWREGGGGGAEEHTINLRFVSQMTILKLPT